MPSDPSFLFVVEIYHFSFKNTLISINNLKKFI